MVQRGMVQRAYSAPSVARPKALQLDVSAPPAAGDLKRASESDEASTAVEVRLEVDDGFGSRETLVPPCRGLAKGGDCEGIGEASDVNVQCAPDRQEASVTTDAHDATATACSVAASEARVGAADLFEWAPPQFDPRANIGSEFARVARILDLASGGDACRRRVLTQHLEQVIHPEIYTAMRLVTGAALFGNRCAYQAHVSPLTEAQCIAFVRLIGMPVPDREWTHLIDAGIVSVEPGVASSQAEARTTAPSEADFEVLRSNRVLREWLVHGTASELSLNRRVPWLADRRIATTGRRERALLNKVDAMRMERRLARSQHARWSDIDTLPRCLRILPDYPRRASSPNCGGRDRRSGRASASDAHTATAAVRANATSEVGVSSVAANGGHRHTVVDANGRADIEARSEGNRIVRWFRRVWHAISRAFGRRRMDHGG